MSDPAVPPPAATEEKKSRTQSLAEFIADLGTGESATLRRRTPGELLGDPVFHRALSRIGIDLQSTGFEAAGDWALIAHVIALTARHGHSLPAGEAMAHAGLSEARFAKLMAARDSSLRDQVAILARHLAAKQSAINWQDVAQLLRAERTGEGVDEARYRLARAYYRTLHELDRQRSA